jgi:4-amino-4-deoxy-L-arabinose transferase-like glycosyltransferase
MSSRRLLLLFAVLLGIYVAGDWSLPLIDRDEPRFAEASREMLQRRDFIVPYFNNHTRFDKPPLIYWLQDAAYVTLGENELAARLPSALCAALAALAVASWGGKMLGPRAGWRAGLIFGLCGQTIVHAHAAVADMAMIAASAGAAWAGWEWLRACRDGVCRDGAGRKTRFLWWLAFWGLLAAGFLAKGPIAWVPIGMVWWLAARTQPGHRPGAAEWILGVVLMLSIVSVWGVPALVQTGGEFAAVGLGKHVVMRSVAPLEGHGARTWWSYAISFPFYFILIWPSFFPWSLWLFPSARELWRRRAQWTRDESYLIAGVVLTFGIFTLSRTKLPHYTLPAFPFLALLLAAWWEKARTNALFRRSAVAMGAIGLALGLVAFPLARRFFVSESIYRAAEPYLTPAMLIETVDYHEPSVVWAFRRRVTGYLVDVNWKDAEDWLRQPGPRVCILPIARMHDAFPHVDPSWTVVKAPGLKVANARRMDLAAVIKD